MLPIVLTALCLAPSQAPANPPMFDALVKEGLPIPGGPRVKLRRPYVTASMSAAQKQKVIDWFLDNATQSFTDRALRAGHYFNREEIGGGETQRGNVLTLAFVAYGKLEDVNNNRNLLDQLLGVEDSNKKTTFLTETDLKARRITPLPKNVAEDRYAVLDSNILDKVTLTGVMRNQTWRRKGELLSIAVLDDRFADDSKYPNRYQRIRVEQRGGDPEPVGKPEKYTGFGGYAQVTELDNLPGALFVELHFAYWEPRDWFGGRDLLVNKIRLKMPTNVEKFRRSLKGKAEPNRVRRPAGGE